MKRTSSANCLLTAAARKESGNFCLIAQKTGVVRTRSPICIRLTIRIFTRHLPRNFSARYHKPLKITIAPELLISAADVIFQRLNGINKLPDFGGEGLEFIRNLVDFIRKFVDGFIESEEAIETKSGRNANVCDDVSDKFFSHGNHVLR